MLLSDISNKQAKLISVLEAAREQVKKHKDFIAQYNQDDFNYTLVIKGLYDTKTVIVMSLAENDALIEEINAFMTKEDNILSEPSMKARFLAADSQVLKEGLLATSDLTETSIIELKSLLARVRPDLLDTLIDMDKQVLRYLPTRSLLEGSVSRDRTSFLSTLDSSNDGDKERSEGSAYPSADDSKPATQTAACMSSQDIYKKLAYSNIPVLEQYVATTEPRERSDSGSGDMVKSTLSSSSADDQPDSEAGHLDTDQKDKAAKAARRKIRAAAAMAASDAIRKNRMNTAAVLGAKVAVERPLSSRPSSAKITAKGRQSLHSARVSTSKGIADSSTDDSDHPAIAAKRAMYRRLLFPRSQSARSKSLKRYEENQNTQLNILASGLSLRQADKPKMALPRRSLSISYADTQRLSRRDYTTLREEKGWPKASDKYDLAQILHSPRDIYGHKKPMKVDTGKAYKYQEEACIPFRKVHPEYTNSLHAGVRCDKDPTLAYSAANKPHDHPVWRNADDVRHEIAEHAHYDGLHSKEEYRHSDLGKNPFHNRAATSATRSGRKALSADHYSSGVGQPRSNWNHAAREGETRAHVAEQTHALRQRHTYVPSAAHIANTVGEPGLNTIKKTMYSLKHQLNDAKAEIRRLKHQVATQNRVVTSFGSAVTGVAQGIVQDNTRVASLITASHEHARREANLMNAKIDAIKYKAAKGRESSTSNANMSINTGTNTDTGAVVGPEFNFKPGSNSRSVHIHEERCADRETNAHQDTVNGSHHLVDLLAPYKCSDGIMSAQKPVVVLGHILDSQEKVMLRCSTENLNAIPQMATALDNLQLSNFQSRPSQMDDGQDFVSSAQRAKIAPLADAVSMALAHGAPKNVSKGNDVCRREAGLSGECKCSRCSRNLNKGFLQTMGDFYDPKPMVAVPSKKADGRDAANKILVEDLADGYRRRRFVAATVKNISERLSYS